MQDISRLSEEQNTITYRKRDRRVIKAIYDALNEICSPTNSIFHFALSKDAYDSTCFNQHQDIREIDGMEGHAFEYFCADLLRKNGFSDVNVTPGSGDQGVDILAEKGGVKYAIQCKNYASPLSNTPVQEVNAGKIFYGCHVGAVMTNSTFTLGAINLAKATGILLWDRAIVEAMMCIE